MADVKVTLPRNDYNPNQRTDLDVEVVNPDGTVSTRTVKGAVQSTLKEDGTVTFGILASAHVPFTTPGGGEYSAVAETLTITPNQTSSNARPQQSCDITARQSVRFDSIRWRALGAATYTLKLDGVSQGSQAMAADDYYTWEGLDFELLAGETVNVEFEPSVSVGNYYNATDNAHDTYIAVGSWIETRPGETVPIEIDYFPLDVAVAETTDYSQATSGSYASQTCDVTATNALTIISVMYLCAETGTYEVEFDGVSKGTFAGYVGEWMVWDIGESIAASGTKELKLIGPNSPGNSTLRYNSSNGISFTDLDLGYWQEAGGGETPYVRILYSLD